MARTKTLVTQDNNVSLELAGVAHSEALGLAIGDILSSNYGHALPPKPIITKFGIKHLDAVLGGGIASNSPVILSSTPETGKSTFAFQFSSIFQQIHPNSVIVYLDVEGAGNTAETSKYQLSRVETFGLDPARFKYQPNILTLDEVFELLVTLCALKDQFEEHTKKQFYILVIWDSVAATRIAKIDTVTDPNKIIGVKARQLSFLLDKYSGLMAFKKISFIIIDQVRSNFKIDQFTPTEKSVGQFKDYKAASATANLHHRVSQWLHLSKKAKIYPGDSKIDVTGWYLEIMTEKNKFAPSGHSVTCVFDKLNGLDKFWSEYTFLSEVNSLEEKLGLGIGPFIKTSGNQVRIEIPNPETGELYKSDKFFRSKAKEMYLNDENFKAMFDYAVDIAVQMRITDGMFKSNRSMKDIVKEEIEKAEEVLLDVEEVIQEEE